jgi:hypothetical protein
MKAVMAPYNVVNKDMQRRVKESDITSFFTESSVFSSAIQPMSFHCPDNFQ